MASHSRLGPNPLDAAPLLPPDRDALEGSVLQFRAWHLDQAAARKAWRTDQWWRFVKGDVASGGRKVFRWVRQPALQAPPPLAATASGLQGGPAAVLRSSVAAWHGLWAKRDETHPAEAGIREAVRALPAFPMPCPLSDSLVAAAVAALPLHKASGPDDWTGDELRLWPGLLVPALAALLRHVELLGRWPSALTVAEVVLIPKPGGDPDSPLQLRPTTLLPVIYRLRARIRLRAVDSWRAAWDPAVAFACKGPEGQAWDLAWALAVAPVQGQAVSGVAVDLSKCYDSVRLPLLRRVLAAAGWPQAIAGPMLAAYGAPRRLRVGEAIGAFVPPRAGLPAGCPLAVSALAVLTWPWQLAVQRAGATDARRYVDDLTAWHRGDPAVGPGIAVRIWEATLAFASAAQLSLHQEKSGLFSGSGHARRELQDSLPQVQVLTSFKDLGVQQLAGASGQAALLKRIQATAARFDRLGGPPPPLRLPPAGGRRFRRPGGRLRGGSWPA